MLEQAFLQHQNSLNLLNEINSSRLSPIPIVLVISSPEERHTGTNEIEASVGKKNIITDNIVDGLNTIKRNLILSKIELSKISGIPRATLYKVLAGELSAEDKHPRVRQLVELTSSLFAGNLKNRAALKNYYIEGRNLLQLLSEESLNSELISLLAEQIRLELPESIKSDRLKSKRAADSNGSVLDPEFDAVWSSSKS